MTTIRTDDPVALDVVAAIHSGDVAGLKRLLDEHPGLAAAKLGSDEAGGVTRSLLHVVTDWPGHFPNGAATVRVLVEAGADVNARFSGRHTETPLHWAASSDDVEVLDALLDAGADIEAPGAVLGGGSPIADAAGFGQWKAAARLVERGAQTNLWQSATLGLMDRVAVYFGDDTSPGADAVTAAFWGACQGGQQLTAEFLLERGADLNWIGYDELTPLDAARRSEAEDVVAWLVALDARSTSELA